MACPHAATLPPRYLTRRCVPCALIDLAPSGKEQKAIWTPTATYAEQRKTSLERSKMITAALRATAQKDYEYIRAHSADPYTLKLSPNR